MARFWSNLSSPSSCAAPVGAKNHIKITKRAEDLFRLVVAKSIQSIKSKSTKRADTPAGSVAKTIKSVKINNTKRAEDPFIPARCSGSDTSTTIEIFPGDNDIALKDVSSRVEPVAVDDTTSFDEDLLASLDFLWKRIGPKTN